ncbi:MAG TPA: hypothetical protein VN764_01215, partial [Polyangiaceae bacterium]|nr:hypothetical protein [Polyangiaceae bacterium]
MRSLSRLLTAIAVATTSLPAQAALLPPPVLAFKEGRPEETKYIEVAMVADAAQVAASGGVDGARQRLDEIASHANRILEGSGLSPRVRLALVDRQIFELDPFQASTANGYAPDEALLVGFSDWSQGLDQTKLDISVLITGQTLLASELGATRRTAVCWPGYNA